MYKHINMKVHHLTDYDEVFDEGDDDGYPIKLVSVSPDAEKHMAYCARVSNPNNQDNEKFAGLLKYCIKHQHWSIFEQAYLTLRSIASEQSWLKFCVIVRSHIRVFPTLC